MKKSWLKYLIYIILIFTLLYLDAYLSKQQVIDRATTFQFSYLYFLTTMVIRICIGFSLGLEYINREMKKEGKWKVNLPKVIFMAIPSLYFSIVSLLFNTFHNEFLQKVLYKPSWYFIKLGYDFTFIFQILLGFFLITSFYKQYFETRQPLKN